MTIPKVYKEYQGAVLWKRIKQSIDELVNNKDVSITTHPDYVYGYLTKSLSLHVDQEVLFMESIDANFPYKNKMKCIQTIKESLRFSDNAAYMVLHEICRAPDENPKERLNELIDLWLGRCKKLPLVEGVVKAARAIVNGTGLPKKIVLNFLAQISEHPGLYNALNIIYCSDLTESPDVERKYQQVFQAWKSKKTEAELEKALQRIRKKYESFGDGNSVKERYLRYINSLGQYYSEPMDYPDIKEKDIRFPDLEYIAFAVCHPDCGASAFIVEGGSQYCSKCGSTLFRICAKEYVPKKRKIRKKT